MIELFLLLITSNKTLFKTILTTNINTNNADTLTDAELAQKQQEFTNALMETPIGALFTTISNDYDESIYNYYDNNTVDNTVNNNVNAIQPNM